MSSATLTVPTVYGSASSAGNLTLDSTSNAGKGNVVLAPSGGNVGIGTTSPGAQLELYTTGANHIKLTGQTTAYGIWSQSDTLRMGTWSGSGISVSNIGNVGIGNTSPSYTLDVTGTLRVTGQAYTNTGNGSFSNLSDARFKDIHGAFDRGLDDILNVDTIKFNYTKDNPLGSDPSKEYVGVTAQNLQKSIPEAVQQEKNGYLTVSILAQ